MDKEHHRAAQDTCVERLQHYQRQSLFRGMLVDTSSKPIGAEVVQLCHCKLQDLYGIAIQTIPAANTFCYRIVGDCLLSAPRAEVVLQSWCAPGIGTAKCQRELEHDDDIGCSHMRRKCGLGWLIAMYHNFVAKSAGLE